MRAEKGGPKGKRRFLPTRMLPAWLRRGARRYGALLTDRNVGTGRRACYAAGGLAGIGAALLLLLLVYALLLLPFTPGIAALKKAKAERPTVLLADDGEPLTRLRRLNREWVALPGVAPSVVDALVATEDHRFYEHHGIDWKRTFGSVLHTLGGDTQGGSTITQQLARNLYPDEIGRSRSLTRKLKEMITAVKIEQAYTKDEILETYLNTVPFLYNVHGIELAARTYFGKSAAALEPIESATLVGMLKGTAFYNPVRNPERSEQRRNVVLSQMVKRGKLSAEEATALKERPIELDFSRQPAQESQAPHFTAFVQEWLTGWADEHGYDLYADGLVVHTTLDPALQRAAEGAVARQGRRLQRAADEAWVGAGRRFRRAHLEGEREDGTAPDLWTRWVRETPPFKQGRDAGVEEDVLLDSLRASDAFADSLLRAKTRVQASFVAIDPRDGRIKAWVGSRSFDESPFDRVADARRQPGSTFKPFVYARALEEGFSASDAFRDEAVEIPLDDGRVWRPTNADGVSGEAMTLRDGLVHSKNTITAQLIREVGAGDVAALARRMGVTRSKLRKVPSLALGTSEVTLLEMVSSYATFADRGRYHPPRWVTRIEDSTGAVVARFEPEAHEALSEAVALRMLDMLRGVVDEGTGRGLRHTFGIREAVGGKTGTTQSGADGWFILVHPGLVSGAWVGFDDPRVTFRSDYWGQGAHNALFVVGDFARQALGGRHVERSDGFPTPPPEEERVSLPERLWRWIKGGERAPSEPEEDAPAGNGAEPGQAPSREDRDREEDARAAQRAEAARDAERETERETPQPEARRTGREELSERDLRRRLEALDREGRKRREERAREERKRWEELDREGRKRREERAREAQKRQDARPRDERKTQEENRGDGREQREAEGRGEGRGRGN